MSNLHDWFQDLYDKNKETIFNLLKVAREQNSTIRLSLSPDGSIIFSSDDGDITKTIVQDDSSITYRQYHEFKKGE